MVQDKRLFLIDGHALIFRMYYALLSRPMINSKGINTSILYGFTKYIFELIEREKPTHLAVSFDPPGGTFRHDKYPEYKGTRSETPQLIIDALNPLCEICDALNIPILMRAKFEADDMIGSMAKKAEKEGYQVFMVTPDKDYGQLISDNIFQLKPGKAGASDEIIDKKGICEKLNIKDPIQVIEFLTICGDSSDNVPGVKGVGEVGAKKLLALYDTVENIYAHIDELSPKQKELFIASKEHIELSRWLVTIKTDIDLSEYKFDDMRVDKVYKAKAHELFDLYEFGSLKRYISHIAKDAQSNTKPAEQKKLESKRIDAQELIRKIESAKECSLVLKESGSSIVLAVDEFASELSLEQAKKILEREDILKLAYSHKAIYKKLLSNKIDLKGKLLDIEIMDYLLNPEKSHKLDFLTMSYLGMDFAKSLKEDESDGKAVQLSLFDTEDEESDEENYKAAFQEAVIIFSLAKKIWDLVQTNGVASLYDKIEEPLIRVLARMELCGVAINTAQLRNFATELSKLLLESQEKIRSLAGEPDLNIMSPKQIGAVLYDKLCLNPDIKAKNENKSSYPTDEETLVKLADKHPIINEILEYRGLRKLLSTYIEPLPSYINETSGCIHSNFNQALTSTGRLSSSKPNLQNIPIRTERGKEIRKAFVSRYTNGLIVSADYSQIELRVMAHFSKDQHLIDAFQNNLDVHASTAAKIFNIDISEVTADQRRIAKTANFGIMYGISSFGLSQRLNIPRNDAKKIIDDYFASFPTIKAYINSTLDFVRKNGYVETLFGRRRYIGDINSKNGNVRMLAERNAINAPIQGTAADIIKLAMINVDKRIMNEGLQSRMALQIHDELLFDCIAEEIEQLKKIVVEEMENVIKLSVPLIVECNYGKNWLEAH